jgi:hypothetical protein
VRRDLERRGVERVARLGADGAEAVEPLRARPLPVALLEVARRDVVERHNAAQGAHGFGLRRPRQARADHDADLPFELHALGRGGEQDGLALGDHARRRLEEEERRRGDLVAQLPGVIAVVATDADDLPGTRPAAGHAPASAGSSRAA